MLSVAVLRCVGEATKPNTTATELWQPSFGGFRPIRSSFIDNDHIAAESNGASTSEATLYGSNLPTTTTTNNELSGIEIPNNAFFTSSEIGISDVAVLNPSAYTLAESNKSLLFSPLFHLSSKLTWSQKSVAKALFYVGLCKKFM